MINISNISLPDFPLLLAPMEDVTDPPFRAICKDNGADLVYTEFISSEGLIRNAMKCRRKLDIFEAERPVGIQIFGGDEESLSQASGIVETTNPDLLDINFGCPVKNVAARGAGAGVLKDIRLMVRLTEACVNATRLPVTVKTRLGWDDHSLNIEEVAERLQDTGIKALTIHGRTRCQMYKGEADWRLIAKVKNNPRIIIPIFGNGDINSAVKALEYKNRYGVDGLMIGRAAISHPWIFREIRDYMQTGSLPAPPSVSERIQTCRTHLLKSIEWKGEKKAIFNMRGKYGGYLRGLPGIKEFLKKLMTLNEVEPILEWLDETERHYIGFEITGLPVELINYHEKCPI
jgi:nifR3 family TIM-barrel protein